MRTIFHSTETATDFSMVTRRWQWLAMDDNQERPAELICCFYSIIFWQLVMFRIERERALCFWWVCNAPHCIYSFDCITLFNWVASLGFFGLVLPSLSCSLSQAGWSRSTWPPVIESESTWQVEVWLGLSWLGLVSWFPSDSDHVTHWRSQWGSLAVAFQVGLSWYCQAGPPNHIRLSGFFP